MSALELLQLLGGTLAKGAMILLVAGTGARLLRRWSAAGRYAVWGAAFTGLLLLPVLTLSLPSLETPRLTRGESLPVHDAMVRRAQTHAQPDPRPSAPERERPGSAHLVLEPARVAGMTRGMPAPVGRGADDGAAWRPVAREAAPWLLGAWLLGALTAAALLARDFRRIALVTRRAAFLRRGSLHELGLQVAGELGVRRPVRLGLTRELAVPVSWGVLRPVVLLPLAARDWDAERCRVVLRHELAHVRRGDYAGHLLIELACALHWPNPLAWRAAHRARLEQEQACDDRVLGLGTRSVDYAQHLLDIARAFASPAMPGRGALAMAAVATLPERMRAILDLRLDHRPAGRRTVLAVAAAAVLLGVPTAAVRPWSDARREAELRAQLDSADPALRHQAAWALGARSARGARPELTKALGNEDPATRGVAAWALGKLGDRTSVPALVAALRDPDAQVREMAVLALGELGDPRVVAALTPLARDPEHGVRSVTTVALERIGGEPAAEALARLVRSDPDAHTRVMAASALSRVESRSRTAVLQAALADSDADVRSTAAWALETLKARAAVPALLAALDGETDAEAREALVHALGATGDRRATGGLVRVLGDTLPRLRETAAQMLGELGDEGAVEPLIAATRDPDHRVRLTAVWALDALERSR
jgi:HEAT repeat protein/beta-lactamase regulating signal transducer with metallopeptidase domain